MRQQRRVQRRPRVPHTEHHGRCAGAPQGALAAGQDLPVRHRERVSRERARV